MILKFVIGFLVFDAVAAVLFWLLIARDAKPSDRKIKRDRARQDRQGKP